MVWWPMFWMWVQDVGVMISVLKRLWWLKHTRANVLILGINGFWKWMNRSEFANKLGFQYYYWESHFFLVLCIIDALDVVIPSLYVIVCLKFSIPRNPILFFVFFYIIWCFSILKWSLHLILHFIHSFLLDITISVICCRYSQYVFGELWLEVVIACSGGTHWTEVLFPVQRRPSVD